MFQRLNARLNAWLLRNHLNRVRSKTVVPDGWVDVRERSRNPDLDADAVGWLVDDDDGFQACILYVGWAADVASDWRAAVTINGTLLLDRDFDDSEFAFAVAEKFRTEWADLMAQPYIVALKNFDWSSPSPGEIRVDEVHVSDDGNTAWGHGSIEYDDRPDFAYTPEDSSFHNEQAERCPVCGQPDNCGDCDHTPLSESEQAALRHWNQS